MFGLPKYQWQEEQENRKAARIDFLYWREIACKQNNIYSSNPNIGFFINKAKENQTIELGEWKFNLKVLKVGSRMDDNSNWSKDASHYQVVMSLEGNKKSYTFFYSQGSGIKEFARAFSIMQSIVLDALAGIEDFEEFCSNFGYDEDSRKAESIYRAVRKVTRFFKSIGLADEELYKLDEIIREIEDKQLAELYPKKEQLEPEKE